MTVWSSIKPCHLGKQERKIHRKISPIVCRKSPFPVQVFRSCILYFIPRGLWWFSRRGRALILAFSSSMVSQGGPGCLIWGGSSLLTLVEEKCSKWHQAPVLIYEFVTVLIRVWGYGPSPSEIQGTFCTSSISLRAWRRLMFNISH